jgi:hypothetical protein
MSWIFCAYELSEIESCTSSESDFQVWRNSLVERSIFMFCRLEEFLVLPLLLWTLKSGGATMHFQPLLKAQKQVLTKKLCIFFILL